MLNTIKLSAFTLCLGFSVASIACSIDGKGGFVPENDLKIPVRYKSFTPSPSPSPTPTEMTEAQFKNVISKVEAIYAPIIAQMGAKLVVERKWSNATVNAYASQEGKIWNVAMFGGLARHKAITEDGLALVVCHEIGHHIGGAPKKGKYVSLWASSEGQADYFAALKCLRKTFLYDNNAKIVAAMNVPRELADACKKSTKNNRTDTALCIRTSMAGKSVAALFSDLGKLPEAKFHTPDTNVVLRNDDNHPKAQCRLDTYFQGSLCDVQMNEDVSETDEVKGTCHPSLGHQVGNRPLCWFKPQM